VTIRIFNGKQASIGNLVYLDDSAVIIGDVSLGDNVSVWPSVVIRGDVESIKIGNDTNIQDGSVLHVSHASKYTNKSYPLTIGKGVTVGHKAVVHGCTVGDYCLIGIGAIVMDDVVIEDYVMLGAGSLVPSGKRLQSGHLYIGSPAKQIRALTEQEKQFLEYSAQHYIQLKNRYLTVE
jgi:carbonic anhydrase/acetyltransferase-like protein (isoleucine patch superfamily)